MCVVEIRKCRVQIETMKERERLHASAFNSHLSLSLSVKWLRKCLGVGMCVGERERERERERESDTTGAAAEQGTNCLLASPV